MRVICLHINKKIKNKKRSLLCPLDHKKIKNKEKTHTNQYKTNYLQLP